MKIAPSLLLGALLLGNSSANANIDIVFDYTYDTTGYFSGANSSRQSVLDSAATVFESRFEDTLLAINPGGGNQFTASFFNPSGTNEISQSFSVATDEIRVFVGAGDLGAGTLGIGGPGGYGVSGSQDFVNTVVARGQAGALLTPASSETDFGPWGGSIAFNNISSFYFDNDTTSDETFTGFDFYSIAVHELGHVLGFGTASSYLNDVSGGLFMGEAVTTLTGTGQPVTADGHWESGLQYLGQETSMDPDIAAGVRVRFTELDFAAMKDIGWEVSPVPEADTWGMMLAGLGLLGWRLNARTRKNAVPSLTLISQAV